MGFIFLVLLGAKPAAAQDSSTWAFMPEEDTFNSSALLDLRSLNEKTAGESGFIHRSADGQGFLLGNGQPVRFWAVTDYIGSKDIPTAQHHARFLAKRGVNMVRFHGNLSPKDAGSPITGVNIDEIDHLWKLVAAMKQQGIYTTFSPYWANSTQIQQSWNIPGGKQPAFALLFWDKTLQQGYKSWLKIALTRPNAYTGIPLAKDPALAIIQLQNEDSMLFWTMQNVIKNKNAAQAREVFRYFGDWLNKKYGSLDKAKAAWDGVGLPADDFGNGQVDMYINWEWTQPQTGGKAKRLADQLEFFAQTMHTFNADMAKYLRDDLGCKQLINDGNWKTCDPVKLDDVERWSYTAGDIMAVNRYFNGIHKGPRSGYAVDNGDVFTNASALLDPRALPVNFKQVVGFPSMVTESQWVFPTAYQAEGSLLVAAYSSLTGVNPFYWFETGDAEWQSWGHYAGIFAVDTPQQLGQFPAAALLFRKGYVEPGATVVHEERSLTDMWNCREPIIAEDQGFDPNRDTGDIAPKSNIKNGVDPLAFLVGRVEVKYDGDPANCSVIDLSKYIDHDAKTINSTTGQLKLNYGSGLFTLDAPKAQAVCGFLRKAGGEFSLSDIKIKSDNDYASIMVVAMDDQPLKESKKILIQFGSITRPTGWADTDITFRGDDKKIYTGKQVLQSGSSPWRIENARATITLDNPNLKSATLLDSNGDAFKHVAVQTSGQSVTVELPPDTMYLVLQ